MLLDAAPLLDEATWQPHLEYDAVADINPLIRPASTTTSSFGSSAGTKSPLWAIPELNSNLKATAQLYVDFDGDWATTWGEFDVSATPAYDRDGDASTFSSSELAAIEEIWARVAEKYSPFNINVTTVNPGVLFDRVALRVVIGGDGAWCGMEAGGIAYVGSFQDYSPNTVYVFPDNLGGGEPKYVAEAAAHEAGHGFGLEHQSRYSSDGRLLEEYYDGNGYLAPIMGNSYDARGVWWYGTSVSSRTYQDDMMVLASRNNGFGYRADDHGNTIASASTLVVQDNSVSASGIIEKNTDKDYFAFTTGAGTVSFSINVIAKGPMLDLKAELRKADGTLVATADTSSLGEKLSATVSEGSYRLVVMSEGRYGDVGQYSLTGNIIPTLVSLAAPADLMATVTANAQVSLNWTDPSDNENGFQIQRSTDGGLSWMDLATVGANVTQYVDAGIAAGGKYLYRVYAFNDLGESERSAAASVTIAPPAPQGLVAVARSQGRIALMWNRSAGATRYIIERSVDGTDWSEIGSTGGRVTWYMDRGLTGGQTYCYRVRAISAAGQSDASQIVSAVASKTIIPVTPTNVQMIIVSQKTMRLVWQDNSIGENGFHVQWSPDGRRWYGLGRVTANRTGVNLQIWRRGTTYFRVSAYNRYGQSSFSEATSTAAATRIYQGSAPRPTNIFSNRSVRGSETTLVLKDNPGLLGLSRAA